MFTQRVRIVYYNARRITSRVSGRTLVRLFKNIYAFHIFFPLYVSKKKKNSNRYPWHDSKRIYKCTCDDARTGVYCVLN